MSYDSCADWFSFGCMIYKLLKGHSPFRQHKTKDKHEIDRMTLTMKVELPDTYSPEVKSLIDGLLQRDVDKRLGCCGKGADEVRHSSTLQKRILKISILLLHPPSSRLKVTHSFPVLIGSKFTSKTMLHHSSHQKAKSMQPMLVISEISMKMIQKLSKSPSKIKRFIKIFLWQFLKGKLMRFISVWDMKFIKIPFSQQMATGNYRYSIRFCEPRSRSFGEEK